MFCVRFDPRRDDCQPMHISQDWFRKSRSAGDSRQTKVTLGSIPILEPKLSASATPIMEIAKLKLLQTCVVPFGEEGTGYDAGQDRRGADVFSHRCGRIWFTALRTGAHQKSQPRESCNMAIYAATLFWIIFGLYIQPIVLQLCTISI